MAGPGASNQVGKVSVRVVPDTSRFREELKALLKKRASGLDVRIPVKVDNKVLASSIKKAAKGIDPVDLKVRLDEKGVRNRVKKAVPKKVEVPVEWPGLDPDKPLEWPRFDHDKAAKDLEGAFKGKLIEIPTVPVPKKGKRDLLEGSFSGEIKIPVVPDTTKFTNTIRRQVGNIPPISLRADLDDDEVAKLRKSVETAQEALTRARDAHTESVQRAVLAEERLKKVRDDVHATGLQIAQAQVAFDQARRNEARRAEEIVRANDRLAVSYRNLENYTPAVEKSSGRISKALDKLSGSSNRARGRFLGLGRAAWITIAIFLAAPPVLAAVAGLLLAIPSALAAIGAAGAAVALGFDGIKDAASVMKDEVESLKATLSDTFRQTLRGPMAQLEKTLPKLEKGLVNVAKGVSTAFSGFTEHVSSARGVEQLNRILNGTARLLKSLKPMVSNFTDAFLELGAVGADNFGMLSGMLNRWSDDFNRMIQRMADNGVLKGALKGTTQVVEALLMLFNDLLEAGGEIMAKIGPDIAEFITEFGKAVIGILPNLTRLVQVLLPALSSLLHAIAPIIAKVADVLADLVEWFDGLPGPVKAAAVGILAGVWALKKLAKAIKGLKGLGKILAGLGSAMGGLFLGGKGKGGAAKNARNAGRNAGVAFVGGVNSGTKKGGGVKKALGGIFGKTLVLPLAFEAADLVSKTLGLEITDKVTGASLGWGEAAKLGFSRGWDAISESFGDKVVKGIAEATPNAALASRMAAGQVVGAFLNPMSESMAPGTAATMNRITGILTGFTTIGSAAAGNASRATVGAFLTPQVGLGVRTQSIWDMAKNAISRSSNAALKQASGVGSAISNRWGAGQQGANNRTQNWWTRIANTIRNKSNSALQNVSSVGSAITGNWGNSQSQANNRTQTWWSRIVGVVRNQANNARSEASRVGSAISGVWGRGQEKARNRSNSAWAGMLRGMASRVGSAIRQASSAASSIRSYMSFSLSTQGSAIMNSLKAGMQAALGNVIGFAASIASQIQAVKGPLPYDRVLLVPAGKAIMEGLLNGLRADFPKVIGFASQIADYLASSVKASSKAPLADAANGILSNLRADKSVDEAWRSATGSVAARWEGQVSTDDLRSPVEAVVEAIKSTKIEIGAGELTRAVDNQNIRNSRR